MPQTIGRSAWVALGLTTVAVAAVVLASLREMRWAEQELADVFVAQAQRRLSEARHRLELDCKDLEENALLAAGLLTNDRDIESVRSLFTSRPYVVSTTFLAEALPRVGAERIMWRSDASADHVRLLVDLRPRFIGALAIDVDLEALLATRLPRATEGDRLFFVSATRLTVPRGALAAASFVPMTEDSSFHLVDPAAASLVGLAAERHLVLSEPTTPFGAGPWHLALVARARGVADAQRAAVGRVAVAAVGVCLCLVVSAFALLVVLRRNRDVRRQLRQAELIRYLQEKTEKVLDNIPAGVVLVSDDGVVTQVNRFVRERLRAHTLGGPIGALFSDADPPSVARVIALLDQARSSSCAQSILGESLELFDLPPGRGCYSLHALPLAAATNDASWLLVIDDLTTIKALEQQLLRAEKLASVGIIASGIAHEIGTPLGVVRARAEFLQGKLPPDTAEVAGLQIIVEQVDRISRTIQQVLDFARVKPAQRQPVPVAAVCANVVELLRFQFEAKGVAVEMTVPPDLPDVLANADELQQVLINLLMNSLQATEAGVVRLTAAVADGRLCLAVEDQGCGIPIENRHRVFDPFFTTKRRGQGTGLGLSIVAQIVRNHDGALSLDSEVGRGTTIRSYWPLAESRHAA